MTRSLILSGAGRYADPWHPFAQTSARWTRETGPARVVCDALGHDTRSYDSPERCRLLANEATWLTAG